MLPEFAASLPALAGLCQPAAGGAASLPSPLASGDGLCPSDGLPEASEANVALPSKAELAGVDRASYVKALAAQSTPLHQFYCNSAVSAALAGVDRASYVKALAAPATPLQRHNRARA